MRIGERANEAALQILAKTTYSCGFALFAYLGVAALYGWTIDVKGYEWSSLEPIPWVTDPATRWATAVVVFVVFLFTLGYQICSRLKWTNALMDTLQPISLPDKYTRQVREAVEGVSIASGMEAPEILVLRNDSLNAFTISGPGKRYIIFTRGLLASMDREELTAVVAHEFAHLKHHHIKHFAIPRYLYWNRLKGKFKQRDWLGITRVILPYMVWILLFAGTFAYAMENDEAMLLFFAAGMLYIASIFSGVVLNRRPKYFMNSNGKVADFQQIFDAMIPHRVYEDRDLVEFEADWTALSWTYFPEGLIRALRKCEGRSCSPQLYGLNDISFADAVPGKKPRLPFREGGYLTSDRVIERMRFIRALEFLPETRA